MAEPHRLTIRVYYEDTDFSGFVYHAGYLRFLERGRTEFLRELGITQSTLQREQNGLVFVVSRIEADYLKPALMDDVLVVSTVVAQRRGASMRVAQTIERAGAVLMRAEVTIAALRGGRPVRLPARLSAAPTRD